ncbi:DUF4037 domain-containing protein [bacterium]|nr:MAG: DUF4037 domain-containing protein [bacterium]
MSSFIPGRQLSERLYREVVRPMLPPELPYAAGLLDAGSDVLGFDTEMSIDHGWGPRLQLFLHEEDLSMIRKCLEALPQEFGGFPTFYDKNEDGSSRLGGGEFHRVETTTPSAFFLSYLGFDPANGVAPADWLATPEQKLKTVIQELFYDSLGLRAIQDRLAYYPDDVWRYQMASVWQRIGQEEHLVGRAGYVGDELGASIIAARLVRDMMRLGFLTERTYAPYPKWFGTAFAQLRCAGQLAPLLQAVLDARGWKDRDARLASVYEAVARMHNALGLTEPLPNKALPFFSRPFSVIHLHRDFAGAIIAGVSDPQVRLIAEHDSIGRIDVFSDNTDLVSHLEWRPKVRALYER